MLECLTHLKKYLKILFLINGFLLTTLSAQAQTNLIPDNVELAILKNIYDSLGGGGWTTKTNWPTAGNWPSSATSAQFGTWFGITVSNGDINRISLSANGLTGQLPATVGQLAQLRYLYIENNSIAGPIPSTYGNLTGVLNFHLNHNQLSGTIPSSLGNLINVKQFRLHNNNLTGSIPTSLGNLAAVTDFYVSYNQLTGSIPTELGSLTNAEYFYLRNNLLTGSLPTSLSALTKVKYFVVGTNQLTGSIPESFSALTALLSFDVSSNQLSGTIPVAVGSWPSVTQLHLYSNKFTGNFPSTIGNCQALTLIYAQNNFLTSLPSGLLSLPVVTALTFYNNDISVIPDFSTQANKTNLNLQIQNNRLDFSQLEMVYQKGIKTLTFSGQKSLNNLAYRKVNPGGQLVITARNAGVNGTYIWERKLEGSTTWTSVTSLNEDATNKTFVKSNLQDTEDGQYRYKMNNSLFSSSFTIQSIPIAVRVQSQDVLWSNLTGLTESSAILSKTAVNGWGNGGAVSENGIVANQDGWIDFVADVTNTSSNYLIGLSLLNNSTYALSDVEYGLELSYTDMKVYAHESNATGIDLGTWAVGDYFKIHRVASTMKYYKNGVEIRSVSVNAAKAYVIKGIVNEGMSPPITSSFGLHPSRGLVADREEFLALKELYDSLGGSGWINKTNWPTTWPTSATSVEFGTWYGVGVSSGDVTITSLSNNNLTGSIPSSIGQLTELRSLYLQGNALSGAIPPSIGNLTKLTTLQLFYNQLTTIPAEIGNLTALQGLNISNNQLTGNIPSSIGNLVNLVGLGLASNNITGTLPSWIGNLTDLQALGLEYNELTGSIPSSIGQLTELRELNLQGNALSGAIPPSIGNLTKLTTLQLFYNQLTTIPAEIGNLTALQGLNISNNQLTGNIPSSIGNLVNLVGLGLASNNITGTLPSWIGNLTDLQALGLEYNELTGSIPSSIGQLTELRELNLQGNALSGAIPPSIGNLTKLTTLQLFYNQLTSIPAEIGNLTALQGLNISNNQLTGNIPPSIGNLVNLVGLGLVSNNLSGAIPSSIGNLANLQALNLDYNELTGSIPSSIGQLTELRQLYLRGNSLVGPIPTALVNLSNLTSIQLNNNQLTSFPDFSARPDKASMVINIQYNSIPIGDIERNFTAGGTHPFAAFNYTPQYSSQGSTVIVYVPMGNDLKLVGPSGGTNGVYVWEKLIGSTWSNITSQNQSSNPSVFLLHNATLSMAGSYRYTVTNSTIVGLNNTGAFEAQITEAVNENPIPRLYNGLITAMHWRTEKAEGSDEDLKGSYFYTYDDKYQIEEARWGENANFTLGTFDWAGNRNRLKGMTYDPNGNILTLRRYDDIGSVKNDFIYRYANSLQPASNWQTATGPANNQERNQLLDVTGYTSSANTAQHGFKYNAIGQMTHEDLLEGADQYVEYDVTGKVRKVFSDASSTKVKVEFTYDDRGFRLSKINYDSESSQPQPVRTTWYIRDASGNILSIYEEDHTNSNALTQTEVPVYGSGKLGTLYTNQDGSMVYELTDHLGNVRALVRDNIAIYTATLEDNGAPQDTSNPRFSENIYFRNIEATEVDDPNFNHTSTTATTVEAPSKSAYLFWQSGVPGMGADDKAIGPSIALQVKGGDQLNLEAYARYESKASYGNRSVGLAALATYLGGNYAFTGAFEAATTAQTAQSIQNGLTAAAWGNDDTDQARPFAYLNYIVFDKNMVYQTAGWQRVSTAAAFNPGQEVIAMNSGVGFEHVKFNAPITISTDGYIYVWVSNESENTKVWFDDILVTHTQNLITQATDYGVWGDLLREQRWEDLDAKYRYGYQGQFAEKDEETDWNHFELREYYPVIGRTTTLDPARQFHSSYTWVGNNPISGTDPTGGVSPIYGLNGKFLGTDNQGLKGPAIYLDESHFYQGMSHEIALQSGFTSQQFRFFGFGNEIDDKVFEHLLSLNNRPDWDGFITIDEGIAWAKAHPGASSNPSAENTLYADASKLDFGNINSSNLPLNMITPVNLFNTTNTFASATNSTLRATVYALGRVNLQRVHGTSIQVVNDDATVYDWNRGGSLVRDSFIREERARNGLNDSHGFKVFYYGFGKLNR